MASIVTADAEADVKRDRRLGACSFVPPSALSPEPLLFLRKVREEQSKERMKLREATKLVGALRTGLAEVELWAVAVERQPRFLLFSPATALARAVTPHRCASPRRQ